MTALRLEALLHLLAARLAVAVLPFARAMQLLVDPVDATFRRPAHRPLSVSRIRGAVAAAARLPVPWASCLPQAMAAHWMLARRGMASRIRFGVKRGPHGLCSHAWLVDAGARPLGADDASGYCLVAEFPLRRQPAPCR